MPNTMVSKNRVKSPAPVLSKPPEDDNADPIYHVERLIDHRKNKSGQYEYLILWTGYDDPSWEKESQIVDKSLITNYWSSKKRIYKRRK